MKKERSKNQKEQTTKRLLDIESKDRLSAGSINKFSNSPNLLNNYLHASVENTFSELLFRLTHEKYQEDKAHQLWEAILKHRDKLNLVLHRDIGILVAALDYLTNVTTIISSAKIIKDKRIEEIAELGTRDALTGLYLRRVFDFFLHKEVAKSNRYNIPLSLLMIDIDDFKKVNDTYGHQTGDEVLKEVANIFLTHSRESDLPTRYGGEEIAIILPATSLEEACILAEKLRKEVFFRFHQPKNPIVTVSIGVASLNKGISSTELIKQTDEALYKAKASGKNQIIKSNVELQ